jgi:uncharacterized membrane protein
MVGSIAALVLAAAVFVLSHSLPPTRSIRERLVRSLGEQGYRGLYSAVAAFSLVWLAWAYAKAPLLQLWGTGGGLGWVPVLAMPLATILLVTGYSTPNPVMIGRLPTAQSLHLPAPGILSITRHPIFWAIVLWAAAHIPPNGDVASLIFFGTIGAYALLGMHRLDRRKADTLGADWGPFAMRSSLLPFVAVIEGRAQIDWRGIGWWRPAVGLALYAALAYAHPWIAGMPIVLR